MIDILNSYTVIELKKEISRVNIKGYSKKGVKKADVIKIMMENKNKFSHLEFKVKKKKQKKAKPKKTTVINKFYYKK
jgi:hypothetical protein